MSHGFRSVIAVTVVISLLLIACPSSVADQTKPTALPVSLSVEVLPAGGGIVGLVPAPDDDGKFRSGTNLVLTATPSPDFKFVSWAGDLGGSENPITVKIQSDMSIVAVFAAATPTPTPTPSVTEPAAPTNVQATAGYGTATVQWEAPAQDGGSPITTYTVTSRPGGLNVTTDGTTPWVVFPGLTNNTTYTFTIKATNAVGSSTASDASVSVTPTAPQPPTYGPYLRYRHPVHNWEISYPIDWEIDESTTDKIHRIIFKQDLGGFSGLGFMRLSVTRDIGSGDIYDTQSWHENLLQIYESLGYTIVSRDPSAIAGWPAYEMVSISPSGETPFQYIRLLFVDGMDAYLVEGIATQERWLENHAFLEELVYSFQPVSVSLALGPPTEPPKALDDIRNFQVSFVSDNEINIAVDYTYSSDHGDDVYLGALILDDGQRLRGSWYRPEHAVRGDGTAEISVGSDCDRLEAPATTQQIVVLMYVAGESRFSSMIVDYEKTWCLEALTHKASISVTDLSRVPGELLTIAASGFEAESPASVRFFSDAFSITIPAVDVQQDSVTVAIPPHIDLETLGSGSIVVDIQVVQEQVDRTVTSNIISGFTIEALPVSTVPPGSVLLAYLEGTEQVILDAQADLDAIAAASQGAISVPELQTNLAALLNELNTLKAQIVPIVEDPSSTLLIGLTTDTEVPIQFSGSDLELLDRIIGSRFIPIFQSFPLETALGGPGSLAGAGMLLRPLTLGQQGVVDEQLQREISRYYEVREGNRLGIEKNAEEWERLTLMLYAGGTVAFGLATLAVTAMGATITAGPAAIAVGAGVGLFLLLGTTEIGVFGSGKIREIAAEIPGAESAELDASKKKWEFREKAYLGGLVSIIKGALTGKAIQAVGGTAEKLLSIIDNANSAAQFGEELIEKGKITHIPELDLTRLVTVTAVPANPAPNQDYSVTVNINPAAEGFYVIVTVHGTDGFTAEDTAWTDSFGFARNVIVIPGAEATVVDTITAVIKPGKQGPVVGNGSTKVVF